MMKKYYVISICTSLVLPLALSVSASEVEEEYVTYKGSINVVNVEPAIRTTHDQFIAGVKRYDFDVDNVTNICSFTGDKSSAIGTLDTSEWRCHFEWLIGLDGLSASGSTVQGVFPEHGDVEVPYIVSIYSGSSEEKIEVASGVYTFDVAAPTPPSLDNVDINWRTERLTGLEQFLGYPDSRLTDAEFTLEPRDYNQKVIFQGKSCEVSEGNTSCIIPINDPALAEINENGEVSKLIGLDSATDYFGDISESLTVSYDYRPPVFSGFYVNDDLVQATQIFDTGDNDLPLDFNQAALVFDVQQSGLDTPWWLPTNRELQLEVTKENTMSNYLEVLGRNRFFEIPYFSRATSRTIDPIDIVELNGQVALIYDVNDVNDGPYQANVDARNKYNVGDSSVKSDQAIISRYPPSVEFFTRQSKVRENADVYFGSDLAIAAHGGWNDGTYISEVLINGSPADYESLTDDPQVVHLTSATISELEKGEAYQLTAIAKNDKGLTSQSSIEFTYANATYNLNSVPTDLYRHVEPLRITVRRRSGARCNFVSSQELAQQVASPSRYACYPVWHNVPNGTAALFSGQSPHLYGAVNETDDVVTIDMDVVYVSHLGEELVIPTSTHSITLLEPTPIDLGVTGHVENENGVILLPEGARDLARARLGFTRGVIEYEITYNDDEPYLSRSLSSSREYTEGAIRINAKQPFKHEIFSENELTVRAWYRYAPEMIAEAKKPLILTPNDSSRFTLSSDSTDGNTLETLNVTASLEKQYERQWTSDPELIGRYNVYVAKQLGYGEYEAISEPKPIENGTAEFELDLSEELDIGNNTLYAIATLAEPGVEQFDDEIVSRRLGFYLFSGEAISGDLNTRTLQGPIPMRARMSYQATSLHESRLIEEYIWEYSNDGGDTWARDESITNHSYSKSHDEPADYMVRVRVRNRLTGLESQSEAVRVIAYYSPRISIDGPSSIYSGISETFRITTRNGELSEEDGLFYWSFDGEEWFEGESEIELELEESTRLYGRFISHSAHDRDLHRPAEVESVRNVRVRDLSPVRINASLPRLVESGSTLLFEAHVRQPITSLDYPVSIEWVDGEGNVYNNMHEYEVTEADINEDNSAEFTARAWMVGLKEETYLERTLRTRPWHYDTPEIRVDIRNSHQIAPVNIRLGIAHSPVFAPFVELEYEWEVPDGVSVARETSAGRYIDVDFTEPGVYEFKAILRDSRGGEAIAYEYVEILEPAQMEPSLDIRFSEQYLRPPLRAVARLSVERTHPNDRVDHVVWYLDGEEYGDPRSVGYFDLEETGTFELKGEVHTRLGQVASVTETVTLEPNQPPICKAEIEETSSAFRVQTNCDDADGRIVRYEWEWDEGISNQNRPTLSFSKDSYESMTVTFRAYDDSGDYAEHTVSW